MYKLSEDIAIVQTVDFFTPIVDDPYDFGVIAAANALSDCYTLGAQPCTALNVVAFPCKIGLDVLREILRGGADALASAGASIVGGHSVQDVEPKYGVAVTGIVHPNEVIRNDGAKVGDAIVINKCIGTGIASNLYKKNPDAVADVFPEVVASMKQLHSAILPLFKQYKINATTDITGFGLLGHAQSVAAASQVQFKLFANRIPSFPGILEHAVDAGGGGAARNLSYVESMIDRDEDIKDSDYILMHDAQTSGPILCTLEAAAAENFVSDLKNAGFHSSAIIGEVIQGSPGRVKVSYV